MLFSCSCKWHWCKCFDTVHSCPLTSSKKQLSLHVLKQIYQEMMAAFMRIKSGLSSLPAWHTCSIKEIGPTEDQFCLDVTCFRESSLSKTLISGPQISCQSSTTYRHRIVQEAVPDKSTTRQSCAHTHKHVLIRRHKWVNSACVDTHMHNQGPIDVSYIR